MPTGKTKNGDAMENVFKGVAFVVVGLVAAIIVYPFTHELGHSIAAWISGAEIYEFNLLPVPNVLCMFDSMNKGSVVLVGFGGLLFPVILTGIRVPKTFWFWYLWFVVKYRLISTNGNDYWQIFMCNYGTTYKKVTPKGVKYID